MYKAIQAKYGFAIPEEYRRMERLGWFDPKNRETYLWIFEAEWLRPEEILEYEPLEFHKPGFVPFAFTGGGDNWCWWPSEGVVVLCPHDCLEGEIDAPDFLSSIYRRTLEYAAGGLDKDDEAGSRRQLIDWADALSPFFPAEWISTLRDAAKAPLEKWVRGYDYGFGFLSLDASEEILRRDLAFPRLGEKFEWMIRR